MIEGGYKSGCKGCCVYPQGMLSIAGMLMALVSWGLSIGVHATCFFVTTNDRFNAGFGFWTKENVLDGDYRCREYTYSETQLFDTKWNAAGGLAYTAGMIGFIFTILLVGTSCSAFRPAFFKLTALFFVVAGILDFCTLVALDSSICANFGQEEANACTFSTGAAVAIGAGISYFITAAIVYCIPPSRQCGMEEDSIILAAAPPDTSSILEDAAGPDASGVVQEASGTDGTEVVALTTTNGDPPLSNTNKVEMSQKESKDMGENAEPSNTSSKETDDSEDAPRSLSLMLWSNILFLNGSVFYLWLSILDLQWARELSTFEDGSWKNNRFRDFEFDDDYVFQTRFHWVSKYQIVYFIAAASFMIEGFVDFFGTPGVAGLFFIFAGTFGLLSSWMAERDADMSIVFGLISAHMYMIEAIGLVVNRDEFTGRRLRHWVFFNDICFVIATGLDVALSYAELFDKYNLELARLDTAAASLWLFCAAFYVGATLSAKRHGYFDLQEGGETPPSEERGVMTKFWDRFKCDRFKAEVLAKTAASLTMSTILSIAYLPNAVPTALPFMVGILGGVFVASFPKLLFSIAMIYPMVLSAFAFALVAATALLACVSVSDGLFVAMFAVYALIMTGLFMTKNFNVTASLAPVFIFVTALQCLTYLPWVKDGLTLTKSLDNVMEELKAPYMYQVIESLCNTMLGQTIDDCELLQPTTEPFTIEGTIPDGTFAGRVAQATVNAADDTLTVNVEGGLYIVGLLWTEKGITNPLAAFRNFTIVVCWGLLSLMVAVILPPIRTQRRVLAKFAIPGALKCGLSLMRWNDSDSRDDLVDRKRKCADYWSPIASGGDPSHVLNFEPRLCKAPFERLVPQMSGLYKSTDDLMNSLVAMFNKVEHTKPLDDYDRERLDKAANLLDESVKLLKDESELQNVKGMEKPADDAEVAGGPKLLDQISYIEFRNQQVLDACVTWIDAFHNKEEYPEDWKSKLSNLKKTFLPWLITPMIPYTSMIESALHIAHPKQWSVVHFFFCLKVTAGYVALLAMSVYIDGWSNFRLNVADGDVGAVFSGWHLVSYAFCWLSTMEGTVKKGIQRIFGTALGGFSAWLGIIVCSWSYDDDAPINPYGLSVWIVVTSVVVLAFGTDKGIGAFSGQSSDHGFAGMYFVLTQNLIALETYAGVGSKSALVANRVVATLTGVAMAIVLAVLPPNVRGGDSSNALQWQASLTDAFNALTKHIANDDSGTPSGEADTFFSTFLDDANAKKKRTWVLYKDANRLKILPLLRVNENLLPTMEEMLLTHAILQRFALFCSILSSDCVKEWKLFASSIEGLSSDDNNKDDENGNIDEQEDAAAPNHRLAPLQSSYRSIQARLKESKRMLDDF